MQKKSKIAVSITTGFALFSMFFGAGNLILPPYIGMMVGEHWVASLSGFFITAILAPFLSVLMIGMNGTSFLDLGKRISPLFVQALSLLIILCIGPLIGIPRTAATTFEVSIAPLFPGFSPILFSAMFFAVVFVLSASRVKMVDIIGKVLTPILLLSLFVIIIVGIAGPLQVAHNVEMTSAEAFSFGFLEGYQTIDVLAAVMFAGIVIASVMHQGYVSASERMQITVYSGIISTLILFCVYGGLIYLGAITMVGSGESLSRTELLLHLSHSILGHHASMVISISIAFACLTTAIALASATGEFCERISQSRINYRCGVLLCCLVAAFLSVNKVDEIIRYATNVLLFIYPITFTLILYILIFGRIVKTRSPYIAAMSVTSIISLISVLEYWNMHQLDYIYDYKSYIPFNREGVAWLLPSLVAFVLFAMVDRYKKRSLPL